jgi:hypothetical protein
MASLLIDIKDVSISMMPPTMLSLAIEGQLE